MVDNAQLIDEKIAQSGLRIDYILCQLGISRQAFHKKKHGKTKFRVSEVYVLCDLLNITDREEREKIFFT